MSLQKRIRYYLCLGSNLLIRVLYLSGKMQQVSRRSLICRWALWWQATSISNLTPWALSADQWEISTHHDIFLAGLTDDAKKELQPELIISCGLSLISKSLKQFLRAYPARQHWHLQAAGDAADTFRGLTRIIRTRTQQIPNRYGSVESVILYRNWMKPRSKESTTKNFGMLMSKRLRILQ